MSKRKIETVPLADLVEDMEIYPRHAVDDSNVQSLALALESGCTLPPIVADRASKKIVDGWHRSRAYRRVYGPGCTVEVEFRDYPDLGAMIEDGIILNASHGRRFDAMDQTRAVLMLERCGRPIERIALAMHITPARVEKLMIRVATAKVANEATVPGTQRITLKRSVAHMRGETLTPEQAKAHDLMPGTSFLLISRQLRTALTTGMANLSDARLMDELRLLHGVLQTTLGGE